MCSSNLQEQSYCKDFYVSRMTVERLQGKLWFHRDQVKFRHTVFTNSNAAHNEIQFQLTGITEQNSAEVSWCLNTSRSEKKIRHAARSLFHRINKTHKAVISREEYLEAISGLTDSVRQQKLLAAAGGAKQAHK